MSALPSQPSRKPKAALKLLADQNTIPYHPAFALLTGSVTGAILLRQMAYWWDKSGGEPFYKFKESCPEHHAYTAGDSWCEELYFSRTEFETARKKIGTHVSKGKAREAALSWKMPIESDWQDTPGYDEALKIAVQHIVIYWRDADNKTWYQINEELLDELIIAAYAKAEKLLSRTKAEKLFPLREQESCSRYSTETTTENKESAAKAAGISSDLESQNENSTSKPDLKIVEQPPRAVQDHMKPIVAFCDVIAPALPSGFDIGAFARISKDYMKAGRTEDQMKSAAELFMAWLNAFPARPIIDTTVGKLRVEIDRALQLHDAGFTSDDIQGFVKKCRTENFWKGQLVPFSHVAKTLPIDKADNPTTPTPAPKPQHDPKCPKCDGTGWIDVQGSDGYSYSSPCNYVKEAANVQ